MKSERWNLTQVSSSVVPQASVTQQIQTNINTDADHAETEVTEKYCFQIARVQELSAPNGERW